MQVRPSFFLTYPRFNSSVSFSFFLEVRRKQPVSAYVYAHSNTNPSQRHQNTYLFPPSNSFLHVYFKTLKFLYLQNHLLLRKKETSTIAHKTKNLNITISWRMNLRIEIVVSTCVSTNYLSVAPNNQFFYPYFHKISIINLSPACFHSNTHNHIMSK